MARMAWPGEKLPVLYCTVNEQNERYPIAGQKGKSIALDTFRGRTAMLIRIIGENGIACFCCLEALI
jgi:hypothetical protein